MSTLSHGIVWLATGASLSLAAAQAPATFRSRADVVVVHAMVEDRRGAAVTGLTAADFLVYEDNHPQEISHFAATDAPASIGLLIDNSTSMMSKRDRVIASAMQFAALSHPQDEIFALAFNERVREAWPPGILQQSDLVVLGARLRQAISARGQTALYDALHEALDRLASSVHARQVLVVVSDGSDNASAHRREFTLQRVGAASAMVYTVILRDPVDRDGDPGFLRQLSSHTGGEAFTPEDVDEIPDALEHIARDIRATYTLGYVPRNQARDGTTRTLRVVASRDGQPLKVRTRSGYVAPSTPPTGGGGDGV